MTGKLSKILPPNSLNVQLVPNFQNVASDLNKTRNQLDGMRLAKQIITELTQTEGAQTAETSRKMPIDLTGRDLATLYSLDQLTLETIQFTKKTGNRI